MLKFQNPLSTTDDAAALAAEQSSETPDEKTVNTLRNKIVLKSAARGLLVAGAIIGTAVAVKKALDSKQDDETNEEE